MTSPQPLVLFRTKSVSDTLTMTGEALKRLVRVPWLCIHATAGYTWARVAVAETLRRDQRDSLNISLLRQYYVGPAGRLVVVVGREQSPMAELFIEWSKTTVM